MSQPIRFQTLLIAIGFLLIIPGLLGVLFALLLWLGMSGLFESEGLVVLNLVSYLLAPVTVSLPALGLGLIARKLAATSETLKQGSSKTARILLVVFALGLVISAFGLLRGELMETPVFSLGILFFAIALAVTAWVVTARTAAIASAGRKLLITYLMAVWFACLQMAMIGVTALSFQSPGLVSPFYR